MIYAAAAFALLAGVLHVAIFYLESVAWTQPKVWRRFGVASQADADTTRPLAFNQGFYNLFLAIGAIVGGAILVLNGGRTVGWTLVLTACGSMLLAAVVLLSTDSKYLRAATTQGLFPALSVVCAVVAIM